MIILLFIYTFFTLKSFLRFNWKNKVSNAKKTIIFNKNNLNKWMNLTKKERYNLSKKESITYLNKRKVLLDEIRKEYKKISKEKSK
tara:strand:+ start:973 stop:1230 length:258 start_codon:yes stop_codon:yes gene_type:complete